MTRTISLAAIFAIFAIATLALVFRTETGIDTTVVTGVKSIVDVVKE